MSPTHVWAIEMLRAKEWRFVTTCMTREEARRFQSRHYEPGASRIRKYVPA